MKEMRFSISKEQVRKYAELSGDFNPIHLELEKARKAGFENVVVHGAMLFAWIVECLYENYGEKLYGHCCVEVRFVSPLFPDEYAKIKVENKSSDDKGVINITIEKSNKEKVAIAKVTFRE